MKRESHLFACHKFLEEIGSQILLCLAKADFRDLQAIKNIYKQIEEYVTTVENHSKWEEEFIFNKFFTKDEVSVLFGEHSHLENMGQKIIDELKALLHLDSQSRIYKGKLIYLDFRMFYASTLAHFHSEETTFLSMLQDKITDDEIRAIDKPIYQSMSSDDMVEMLTRLLPPTNFSEKSNILNDLKNFNSASLDHALPEIRKILTHEEADEILG